MSGLRRKCAPGGLLLAHTTDAPFRLAPARARDWRAAPDLSGLAWSRVSDWLSLSGDTDRSGGQLVVFCELPHGASLITAVGGEVPLVVRPEPPPLRSSA